MKIRFAATLVVLGVYTYSYRVICRTYGLCYSVGEIGFKNLFDPVTLYATLFNLYYDDTTSMCLTVSNAFERLGGMPVI